MQEKAIDLSIIIEEIFTRDRTKHHLLKTLDFMRVFGHYKWSKILIKIFSLVTLIATNITVSLLY